MARKRMNMDATRVSLAKLEATAPNVDLAILHATTGADVERHMQEDGEDPAAEPKGSLVVSAAAARNRLGLSQPAFASLIGVPIGTLRNWEQGRVSPDPAARTLMLILFREPEAAIRALRAA